MIIAECCSNHGGDMELARKMILSAKESGADLVKFQLYNAEDDKGKPHYEWVKKAELSFDQAKMLFDYGAEVGIEVFFSVFGVKYVDWCEKIGVKRYKISYGEQWNEKLCEAIPRNKRRYISTDKARFPIGGNYSYLYCISRYPALSQDLHLSDISFYQVKNGIGRGNFNGFSDHTIGLDAAKIALARGARIIEKHFILDREHSKSPEKEWSMIPDELRELKRWETICQKVLG